MKDVFTFELKRVSVSSGEVSQVQKNDEQTFVGLIERMMYYYYLKTSEYVHGQDMGGVYFVNVFYKDYEVSAFLSRVFVEDYHERINAIWEANKLNYEKYFELIKNLEKEFFEELEAFYE